MGSRLPQWKGSDKFSDRRSRPGSHEPARSTRQEGGNPPHITWHVSDQMMKEPGVARCTLMHLPRLCKIYTCIPIGGSFGSLDLSRMIPRMIPREIPRETVCEMRPLYLDQCHGSVPVRRIKYPWMSKSPTGSSTTKPGHFPCVTNSTAHPPTRTLVATCSTP